MRRTTLLNTTMRSTDRSGSGTERRADQRGLRITSGHDGAIVVSGDLDAASAASMERALEAAEAGAAHHCPLVVDLRGVEFMDSSGLRTLVAASLRAGRRGTHVALRNVGPELGRLLEITGLRDQFGLTAAGTDGLAQPAAAPPSA